MRQKCAYPWIPFQELTERKMASRGEGTREQVNDTIIFTVRRQRGGLLKTSEVVITERNPGVSG